MMTVNAIVLGLELLALLAPARGTTPARPPVGPAAGSAAVPAARPATRPTTGPAGVPADQATALARRIEAGIAKADQAPILAAFDYAAFQDRILADDPLQPKDRRDMLAGLRNSMGFNTLLEQSKLPGATYRLLRVRPVGGEMRALFRLVSDAGDNYHDWIMAPGQRGPVLVDMHNYGSGELLSQTVRRAMLSSAGVTGPDGKPRIHFGQGAQGAA